MNDREILTYEVLTEAWINGHFRKKGDLLKLTAAQAKYYAAPHGDTLRLVTAKKAAQAAPARTESKGAK